MKNETAQELENLLEEKAGYGYWRPVFNPVKAYALVALRHLFNVVQDTVNNHVTEQFRNDWLVDMLEICELVYDESEQKSVYYVGIRKNGVDHAAYIVGRLCDYRPTIFSEPLYYAIYKFEIDKTQTDTVVRLYKYE